MRTKVGIIALTMFVLGSASARAQVRVTLGQPHHGKGTITIRAEIPGVAPQTQGNPPAVKIKLAPPVMQGGKVVSEPADFTITIPANSSDIDKANDIAVGLKLGFGDTGLSAGLGRDPNNPNNPTVLMPKGSTFSVTNDKTGEPLIAVAVLGEAPAKFNILQIGWGIALAGKDVNGDTSVFEASFGYDGLTDSATIDASQLPSLTLTSLEEAMFAELEANLPSSLQPDLVIDTNDLGLSFKVPDGSLDPFMSNFTTDTDTSVLGGLNDATAPEPMPVVLLATGLLAMALVMRKRLANGASVFP
jgi:hypothetical protein